MNKNTTRKSPRASKKLVATTRVIAGKKIKTFNKSKVDNPVELCWNLYSANPKLRRRDAVALALAKGVAFYTARSQYQFWRAAGNAGKKGTK